MYWYGPFVRSQLRHNICVYHHHLRALSGNSPGAIVIIHDPKMIRAWSVYHTFLFFAKNSVEFNVCSPVQFNLMAEPINSKANYLNALFKATARKNIDILHHCISAHCPIVFYIFDLLFLLILVVWNFQRTLFRYSELLLYLRSWDSCCFHFCYG